MDLEVVEACKVVAKFVHPAKAQYDFEFLRAFKDRIDWQVKGEVFSTINYYRDFDMLMIVVDTLKELGIYMNSVSNRKNYIFQLYKEKEESNYSPFEPYYFCTGISNNFKKAVLFAVKSAILGEYDEK